MDRAHDSPWGPDFKLLQEHHHQWVDKKGDEAQENQMESESRINRSMDRWMNEWNETERIHSIEMISHGDVLLLVRVPVVPLPWQILHDELPIDKYRMFTLPKKIQKKNRDRFAFCILEIFARKIIA